MDQFDLNRNDDIPSSVSMQALLRLPFSIVISDSSLDDNPLVYVNAAFEVMTGYQRAGIIGKNCRFLQGEKTDPAKVAAIREAVTAKDEITTEIVNYRADGSPFTNRLTVSPLAEDGATGRYFLGVQVEILPDPDPERQQALHALAEVQHRVKNHLSMLIGLIRMQARDSTDPTSFSSLSRRVESLQLLYEEMENVENDATIPLGAYISRIANAIGHLEGRSGVRTNVDADAIEVPFEVALRIGLTVSEILTNAMQHAFEGRDEGMVETRLKSTSNGGIRIQVSDDGVGIPEDAEWPSSDSQGGRIVKQLVQGLRGTLSVSRGDTGTIITLDIPIDESY